MRKGNRDNDRKNKKTGEGRKGLSQINQEVEKSVVVIIQERVEIYMS